MEELTFSDSLGEMCVLVYTYTEGDKANGAKCKQSVNLGER